MRKDRTIKQRIIIYFIGILTTGFAVSLLLRGELGVGSWDATSFNFNDLITIILQDYLQWNISITYGTTAFMISFILLIIVALHFGVSKRHLLVLASIFLISLSIDFWNLLVLGNFHPDDSLIKIILFGLGTLILPLGLAILIMSEIAAAIHDEFTMVIKDVLKIKKYSQATIFIRCFSK